MSRATAQWKTLAARLLSHEERRKKSSAADFPPGFEFAAKMRPHLATLMGDGGFRALLARSVTLAKKEVPWLGPVSLNADGSFQEIEKLRREHNSDEFFEAKVVILAHLLGLLVAFVGVNLTLRLVHEVWPTTPLDDLPLSEGAEDEKAK